eukprot:814689-Alexandrium_andersonii.AAC.1
MGGHCACSNASRASHVTPGPIAGVILDAGSYIRYLTIGSNGVAQNLGSGIRNRSLGICSLNAAPAVFWNP